MAKLRIIARYGDGRMLKGHTENFNPSQPTFNIHPVDVPIDDIKGVVVNVHELKAIFVVKSFEGNPDGKTETTTEVAQQSGTVLRVTFKDGEQLAGTTMTYDPNGIGFFLFPLDCESNNERVYVVNASVKSVEHVNMAKAG